MHVLEGKSAFKTHATVITQNTNLVCEYVCALCMNGACVNIPIIYCTVNIILYNKYGSCLAIEPVSCI